MAASTFVKLFLTGCLLCLFCTPGDASLAEVASLTNAVVEQTIAAHRQMTASAGSKYANRLKREVITKQLDDPKGCVSECGSTEAKETVIGTVSYAAKLVSTILEDFTGDENRTKTPEEEAAFKKEIETKTIASMGPLFEIFCEIQKNKSACLSKCPESQARAVVTIVNEGSLTTMCEPSRNWASFPEYWAALNCTNTTQGNKPCDGKCGADIPVRNATKLNLDDGSEVEEEGEEEDEGKGKGKSKSKENDESQTISIKYETDATKNTAAAGPACKSITCHLDCYKPIITKKCGAKAFEMYDRMKRVEPKETLRILKVLKAINPTEDCKPLE